MKGDHLTDPELDEALAGHDKLRNSLHQVREAVATEHCDPRLLADMLTELVDKLRSHFQQEEADVMASQAARVPQGREWAEALFREHAGLVDSLQETLHVLDEGDLTPIRWAKFEAAFDDFVQVLAEHKRRERQLLPETQHDDAEDD